MSSDSQTPLEVLEGELEACGIDIGSDEWRGLKAECSEARFRRRADIFPISVVPRHVLFMTQGIAAATYLGDDGNLFVYRFFERGQFCTTITSVWRNEPTCDAIYAVTASQGVLIPFDSWRRHYARSGPLGSYFREKLVEAMLFDKEVILTKTFNRTESAYSFLETHQPEVIRQAPQNVIAQFLGVTPEGLSRFLRNRRRHEL